MRGSRLGGSLPATRLSGVARMLVYGTLRPGPMGDAVARDVVVSGEMRWVWGGSGYPITDFTRPGRVVCDVIEVDEETLRDIWQVETGAGYWPTLMRVDGFDEELLVWQYDFTDRELEVCDLVPDGDWLVATRRKWVGA